jgi:hypothetical protein
MKKTSLTICLAFAFLVTAAVAQTAGGRQTPPSSSPGASQAGQQPGYPQQPGAAENPGMTQTQTDQTANPNQTRNEKGEKRLKGCVQSQGGQYVLETKKGKTVPLTGQDVSAHVGHEVSLKGNWESGGGSAVSSNAAGSSKTSEKMFNVSSVEMISDTCGGKAKGTSGMGSSGTTGTAPSSTSPTGNEPSGQQAPSSPPPQNQPPQ